MVTFWGNYEGISQYTATFRDIHTASNTDLILVKIQTDNKMNILNVYVKNV
ncbi:hypothetical protein AC30_2976 [Escherichia coli 3-020-07_S3_C2]|nr:hypothetical protein AC30_2976 [Escherichia coli 3-020-07_S3_C2]